MLEKIKRAAIKNRPSGDTGNILYKAYKTQTEYKQYKNTTQN